MARINVLDKDVAFYSKNDEDYISLTDIARYKDERRTDYLISNWLRNRNTIEFIGLWETINNPDFNPIEFDGFRKRSGLNNFILTARQWIEKTNSIGINSKSGRYGETYAHKDIAFEFASWISVEFKLNDIAKVLEVDRIEEQDDAIAIIYRPVIDTEMIVTA
ncbi:hypothetical protein GQ472_05745 [archaeon]|nr:hypothetical protein [archaeon]